jgi:hypothetical protein
MLDLAIKGIPARNAPTLKADAVVEGITTVEPQMRRYRARVTRTVHQTATVEYTAMSDADRNSLAETLAASVPDDAMIRALAAMRQISRPAGFSPVSYRMEYPQTWGASPEASRAATTRMRSRPAACSAGPRWSRTKSRSSSAL